MRRLAPLLVLLCAVGAEAKEPKAVECGLYAFVDSEDAGSRVIYDGLRKGLELAHLPRVCIEEVHERETLMQDFVSRVEKDRLWPLFGIGDGPWAHLSTWSIPRVAVVERYSVKGKPLEALPSAPAVVYADMRAEQVGRVLAALCGSYPSAEWAASSPREDAKEAHELVTNALRLAAIGYKGHLLLHLRVGLGMRPDPFELALKAARRHGQLLISDDRGRFGQGAIVTLVPRHDLVGRAAAEAARKLRANPKAKLEPQAITGFEVWVDLQAADEQGVELPLAFLAKADKLRRGKRRR